MSPERSQMPQAGDSTDPRFRLLEALGAAEIPHNSDQSLLEHLAGTHRLMRAWSGRPALCDAALFHSIYGTEFFGAGSGVVDGGARENLRAVIGAEAEALVWLWCCGRRQSLRDSLEGRTPPRIMHRSLGRWIRLRDGQLDDIINLWIADTLEQLPRVPQRSLPTARSLMRYRARGLPGARAALENAVGTARPDANSCK